MAEKPTNKQINSLFDPVLDILLGKRATTGSMAGKRYRFNSIKPIDKKEYVELAKKGTPPTELGIINIKNKPFYWKATFERGGIAGFVKRNPGKAAAIGVAGALGTAVGISALRRNLARPSQSGSQNQSPYNLKKW